MNSRPFVFEEIETGIAAIKAQVSKAREQADGKRAPRRRKRFAPHLERIETVIEPEELAEHAGKQKVLIGEEVSERLYVVPVKFSVIVTRRPKYAFKNEDGVIQAPAPAHIIEGGIPTEALLAQIAVAICRWPAALPAGGHLRPRQGRARPPVDRAMDGQARLRAGDRGRLRLQRGQEGRTGLCRRNHLADARSRLRIDENGLLMGLCQR